jgi:predicted NBD/HSP70 family sugar kinase
VRYLIGMDIGGTNLVTGAVAEDGSRLLGLRSEPTRPEEGPDAVLLRLAALAREHARPLFDRLFSWLRSLQAAAVDWGGAGPAPTAPGTCRHPGAS